MNKDIQSNIKNIVLDKIKHGDVKKIPKFIFSLKGVLLLLAIIIIFAFLLFLISFILFALQVSELWYLPAFGFQGIELLLSNFPWLLVSMVIFFIIILEILVSRYSFAYRRPLLYSALLVIIIVVAISFIVRETAVHEKIYIQSGGPIKSFYDRYAKPNAAEFHPGTALEVNDKGLTLELSDKSTIFVNITKETKIRPDFKIFPGARLLVIGKIRIGIIEAEAIDNAPPGGRP